MQKLLLIILVNFIAYFKTLSFQYVGDDRYTAVDKPQYNFSKKLWLQFIGRQYYYAPFEHLTSLLIHTFNCSLIYWVFGANEVSFVTALLFALNPATLQGSVALFGRFYALSLTVVLLMINFISLAPIFYFSTLYFQIAPIFAPLLFIGTQFWYWVFLLPVWLFLAFKYFGLGKQIDYRKKYAVTKTMIDFSPRRVIIFIKAFAYYFLHVLLPRRIGGQHAYLYTHGNHKEDMDEAMRIDRWFFIGLAIIFLVLTGVITDFMGVRFGLFWFSLFISMWCGFPILMHQMFGERYVYLPCVGLMLAVSNLFTGQYILITALLVYYSTRLWFALGAYKDNRSYVEYCVYDINHPTSYYAWLIKGEFEREHGRLFKALESWSEAYKLKPRDSRVNFQLAHGLASIGFYNEALIHINISCDNPLIGADESLDPMIFSLKRQIVKLKEAKDDKVCVPG